MANSKFIKLSEYNNVKKDYTALREKLYDVWKKVINEGNVQVSDTRQKQNLAVLLENTRQWINESSVGGIGYGNNVGTQSIQGTGAFGNLHSLVLPLVKRVFAKSNVIQKLVDTQPMLSPAGLAFGLRFQRGEFGEEGSLNKMREFGRPTSNRVSGSGLAIKYVFDGITGTGTDVDPYTATVDITTGTLTGLTAVIADSSEPDFIFDANTPTEATLGANAFGMKVVTATIPTDGAQLVSDIEADLRIVFTGDAATDGWNTEAILDLIIAEIPENYRPVNITNLAGKMNVVREASRQNYPVDTPYASVLGQWKSDLYGTSNEVPGDMYNGPTGKKDARFSTMRVGVSSKSVTAGTRAIKTDWPIELEQDMRAVQNVSLEDVLVSTMEQMITLDIERELIAEMKNLAVDKVNGGEDIFAMTMDDTQDITGSWTQEKLSTLLTQLTVIAGRIKTATRLGRGNFAILAPSVSTSLLSVSNFFSGLTINDSTSDDDNYVGRVNKLDIYEDSWGEIYDGENWDLSYTEALIGYKGNKEGESGVIYMPYQPVQLLKATDPNSLQPIVAIKTRYSVMSKVIDSGSFYRGAIIKGIDSMLSLTNEWV